MGGIEGIQRSHVDDSVTTSQCGANGLRVAYVSLNHGNGRLRRPVRPFIPYESHNIKASPRRNLNDMSSDEAGGAGYENSGHS